LDKFECASRDNDLFAAFADDLFSAEERDGIVHTFVHDLHIQEGNLVILTDDLEEDRSCEWLSIGDMFLFRLRGGGFVILDVLFVAEVAVRLRTVLHVAMLTLFSEDETNK